MCLAVLFKVLFRGDCNKPQWLLHMYTYVCVFIRIYFYILTTYGKGQKINILMIGFK